MLDLRRSGKTLTLYATHQQSPRPLWIAGSGVAFGALYYFVQDKTDDPTLRLALAAVCIVIPLIVAAVLYLTPHATTTVTSFDPNTRRIRTFSKRGKAEDGATEVGFDEVRALQVTKDHPERPREDILQLDLTDGRVLQLAVKSRQFAEGQDGPNQDLRKIAAFVRSETGLPSGS